MKRIAAVVVSLILALSGVSALAEGATFTPATSYDPGARTFHGGSISLELAGSLGGGEVDTTAFAGEAGKDYSDPKVYTYKTYLSGMGGSGLNWNPHAWETSDDNYIMTYNNIGFYDFAVNAEGNGYAIIPEMAAELPVDVTAEYVGSYGILEGDVSRAYRIALNQSATWETGEKITADDYIYSMQQQLNPKMLNRRADSFYSGEFQMVNAQNYLYAGKTTYSAFTSFEAAGDKDVCVDMWGFYGLEGALDADGNACPHYVLYTDETLYQDPTDGAWVSASEIYAAYLAPGAAYESEAPNYLYVAALAANVTWEDVGLKKIDEYTIDIILQAPMSDAAFYMPYYLSSTWLVYQPLYESCKMFFDADGNTAASEEEATTVSTNYCKSVETTMGYGPYKLTYYELDKQITLERNENWYGYADGRHTGQFMTDRIVTGVIKEQATALMSFLAGELDDVSLVAANMEKYATSKYIQYTPQSYTTKVSFNTNYEKLLSHGTNSQVVVIDEFRQAFAYALDRQFFASSYTSAGTAGYGLLNYLYVYDPFTGALYRDSEFAQAALVELNGLTYGEGGDYATLEEAYDAMTGFDMAAAQELMKVAYDKAVAAKIYDGVSPVEIEFRVYNSDTIYLQMFTYFDTQIKEAVKGSGYEGKLSLKMTVDPDYYETMYAGGADMIFTTWGGSSFSPFGTLGRIYCDDSAGNGNQMEVGFDTTQIMVTFTVDGKEVTACLQDWAKWANNEDVKEIVAAIAPYGELSYANRCAFYAGLEQCYLSYYVTTSMYYRNVASLKSQKVNDAVDTYLQLVAFGGIRHITYNYDDAEWAAYVASAPLDY